MNHQMITASLSPNTEIDDIVSAIETVLQPSRWKKGNAIEAVHTWFRERFTTQTVYSFSSGRMALFALLDSFGIGFGDEVFVQAFTCVAVPNSVLWAKAKPIFVDIDDSGNIDVNDAQKKLTTHTKAMIVQHTFGIAADMQKIVAFCKKNNLLLIEDCAHSLGVRFRNQLLGTFGDAAFFSFGRDKVLSSVWGGIAIVHTSQHDVKKKLMSFSQSLSWPRNLWILRQLFHPILFAISMPLYRNGIGKVIIVIFRVLRLITIPIYPVELSGGKPDELCTTYPNGLARLLLKQLGKLDAFTMMRNETTNVYKTILAKSKKIQTFDTPFSATYLRFPLLVADPKALQKLAKKEGILLGNWYEHIVDPNGVSFESIGYRVGSCPKAEAAAKHILNVPTRLSLRERERVSAFLARHV